MAAFAAHALGVSTTAFAGCDLATSTIAACAGSVSTTSTTASTTASALGSFCNASDASTSCKDGINSVATSVVAVATSVCDPFLDAAGTAQACRLLVVNAACTSGFFLTANASSGSFIAVDATCTSGSLIAATAANYASSSLLFTAIAAHVRGVFSFAAGTAHTLIFPAIAASARALSAICAAAECAGQVVHRFCRNARSFCVYQPTATVDAPIYRAYCLVDCDPNARPWPPGARVCAL